MIELSTLLARPARENYAIPLAEVEAMQLKAAGAKFDAMIDKIPMLKILANKQGITSIGKLEDLTYVLFKHTTLKSYPMSFLEDARFDKLTAWLDKLTAHNLSGYDVSGIETIDDWLVFLEEKTPMRVAHSSGTSGKLSFFPRSTGDMPNLVQGIFKGAENFHDDPLYDLDYVKDLLFVWPAYRGGNTIPRFLMDGFAGMAGEENILTLYPGRMSADVLSLQGRIRTAEAAGRLNELKIHPALIARREQMTSHQNSRPDDMRAFLETYVKKHQGRPVFLLGFWASYMQMKATAEELDLLRIFPEGSILTGGGGNKGQALPPDYQEQVAKFLQVDWIRQFYGMTEVSSWIGQCENRNYHIPPYTIPFLLDVDTGEVLPRSGRQTGRFCFFDLLAETYWGGCISGDEITIEWEQPCGCGRGHPFIPPTIGRVSEKRGSDDKISCSGAQAAHEDAINFLATLKAS